MKLSLFAVVFFCAFSVGLSSAVRRITDILDSEDEQKEISKRSDHMFGIIYFFADLDRNNKLDYWELKRFFSCDVFGSETYNLIEVAMSRDLNDDKAIDIDEWEDISSISRHDLAMLLLYKDI